MSGYKVLRNTAGLPVFSIEEAAARAKEMSGKGRFRQWLEATDVRFGPGKLSRRDYYLFGVHNPAFSRRERRSFVGHNQAQRFCASLTPSELPHKRPLSDDKLLFTLMLDRCGIPTPRTQAVFSRDRVIPGQRVLRSADDIRDFLTNTATYPLFGKPGHGMMARGALGLRHLDNTGSAAIMGNGRSVELDALIAEVLKVRTGSFLFQDHVISHPDLAVKGTLAVGTLRICTVREGKAARPLYAFLRVPLPHSISDEAAINSHLLILVDPATGQIERMRNGNWTFGQDVEHDPDYPTLRPGATIPHWEAACRVACDAHEIVSSHGAVAWDIALTPDGPIIFEGNTTAMHPSLQTASGRGLLDGEVGETLQRIRREKARAVRRYRRRHSRLLRFRSLLRKRLRRLVGLR